MIILTPTRNQTPEHWFIKQCAQYEFEFQHCPHNLFKCRNALLELAISRGHGVAIFVDDDIIFTQHDVEKILRHPQKIVSGAYVTRRKAGCYCACSGSQWVGIASRGFIGIEKCGAGFLKIDLSILPSIPRPWFRHEFVGDTQTSEDFGFCIHAMRSGFKIWLDCDCIVNHLL
jgi:hypothetical protein